MAGHLEVNFALWRAMLQLCCVMKPLFFPKIASTAKWRILMAILGPRLPHVGVHSNHFGAMLAYLRAMLVLCWPPKHASQHRSRPSRAIWDNSVFAEVTSSKARVSVARPAQNPGRIPRRMRCALQGAATYIEVSKEQPNCSCRFWASRFFGELQFLWLLVFSWLYRFAANSRLNHIIFQINTPPKTFERNQRII